MSMTSDLLIRQANSSTSSLPRKKSRTVGLVMTYNQENTCIAAIESLISQTQELDLILVSDDCSTDSTFKLIQEFCEKITTAIKIEYYQNSRNLGLIAHFNLLVQKYLISSDLIFSNSGDDESEPTRVWEFFSRYRALGGPRYYLGTHMLDRTLAENQKSAFLQSNRLKSIRSFCQCRAPIISAHLKYLRAHFFLTSGRYSLMTAMKI